MLLVGCDIRDAARPDSGGFSRYGDLKRALVYHDHLFVDVMVRRMRAFARAKLGDVQLDGNAGMSFSAEHRPRFAMKRKILELVNFRGQRRILRRSVSRQRRKQQAKISPGIIHVNQCTDFLDTLRFASLPLHLIAG